MAAADSSTALPELAPRRIRHKSVRRRLARDARQSAHFVVLGLIVLLTLGTTLGVERMTLSPYSPFGVDAKPAPGLQPMELAYSGATGWTMAMSSTSNVSAAPPGILGGAPLSP